VVPLTVLVVIPDAARADRVARAVVSAGHAPILVGDGERAIDRFVQEPADVVIAEFFLPGRDGATTVESIRWAPGGRQVHAVLLATEEPETAALATIGSRIDAVATFVGDPPLGKLTEILRSLDRKAPSDPRARGAGELPPESVRWLERTTSILKGDDLASRYAAFDGHEDESTVRGSAQVARAILEAARAQTGEKSAPKHVEISTMEIAKGGPADATRLSKRRSEEHPADVADPAALAESKGVRHAAERAAERASSAAPAAPDPFAGRFESTSFPQLLVRLAEARVTGGLLCIADQEPRDTITGDAPTKMVHFRGGVPVMVRSNLVDECLGQLLLRKKRIGAATLEESVRRMTLGHGLQGEILIDMGALSPFEVSETLAEQAREKLFDLFGWRHGSYRLTDAELPKDHAPLELALPEMVYEGICAAMPTTRLLDILTPMLDRYVVPDAQRLARFVRVRLPVELKAILARVDGATTLRLLLAMGTKPGAVAQLVYAMHCLGAVRFEESARKRVSEPPSGSPSLSQSQALQSLPSRSAATPRSIDAASFGPAPTARLKPLVPGGPMPSPASGTAIPPSGERGAAAVSGERALSQSSPASPAVAAPARGLVPFSGPSESWDDSTTPQPDPRAVAEAPPPPPPAAPTPLSSASTPLSSDARPLDGDVDRLFEAERHFRRGNRALERERWSEALSAFEQAAALCPTEGEFVAYVAWARHCSAPDSREGMERALAELDRAVELAPQLFVVNLLRARVLGHAGLRAEARAAYQRVLQLEPSSDEARAALARLDGR
jgi:CheY-like chemotaxis protein